MIDNNKIVYDVYKKRKGIYCHALEVNNIYELQACLDSLYDEFIREYTLQDIINFFDSIELYCLDVNNENEVYDFDINKYLLSL